MSKSLNVEIFAVGKWNGIVFDKSDLQKIVDNFKQLKEVLKVPLKFGHNEEQPMTDGEPAIGWVDNIWIDSKTGKMMAKFVNLPTIVYDAMKKMLYRKVSIELDRKVIYKDEELGDVLTGCALLGADLPAVSTIDDLKAYMAKANEDIIVKGQHCAFIAISNEEDTSMTTEIEKLTKGIADLRVELSTLQAKNAELEKTISDKEAEDEKRLEQEKADKIKLSREAVNSIFEEAIENKQILPAQREKFSKLLRVDDDDAVQKIDIDELKEMVGQSSTDFSKDKGAKTVKDEDDGDKTPDVALTDKANELLNKGEVKTFSKGFHLAMQRNPELAEAYRDQNDQQ